MPATTRNRIRIRRNAAAGAPGARFRADLAAGLRTLAGISAGCPACGGPTRRGRVCERCIRQSTGPSGPWQLRRLDVEAELPKVFVRYFGRYDCLESGRRSEIAGALSRFKYGGRRDCGRALAALVRDHAPQCLARVDAVVPVALTGTEIRRRGFNQAAVLARPLAASLGAPVVAALLRKVSGGGPQAGRGAAERRRRSNPFVASARAQKCARILLVDDVCTTGTTIRQAAKALLCAGALRVDAAVLLNSDRRSRR